MSDDIVIRVLDSSDIGGFTELIDVFSDVFEMKDFSRPSEAHLQKILTSANFLVLVAKKQEQVIGGLTVYILEQYYAVRPLAYLYDLAVAVQFQRQGIGRKLIAFLLDYCRQNNLEEMFVQADKVDDYALDFYRSTSPDVEEETVTYSYLIKGVK